MIRQHYLGLRAQPQYRLAYVRVFIEANMSFIDAGRVADQLSEPCFKPLEVVRHDKQGRYGIWTTRDRKMAYCDEIRRAVPHMRLATVLVTAKPRENIDELCAQLGQFRIEHSFKAKEGESLFCQRVLTGKSTGQKDDLWMALGIAIYYMHRSRDDTAFVDMCEHSGRVLD